MDRESGSGGYRDQLLSRGEKSDSEEEEEEQSEMRQREREGSISSKLVLTCFAPEGSPLVGALN
jgi:hypothetical protein